MEYGLPSCDPGGQAGEGQGDRLEQLLDRPGAEGVWVSTLRVLLLRCWGGKGARRPSGTSRDCAVQSGTDRQKGGGGYVTRQRRGNAQIYQEEESVTFSSSFSPLSLIKTFSSSWLMPSMLLGTLEMEGFGTVMLDSGIWDDFDMENRCRANTHTAFTG